MPIKIVVEKKAPVGPTEDDRKTHKKVRRKALSARRELLKIDSDMATGVLSGNVSFLVGLRPLYELLKLTVYTGRLIGHNPVSTIVVAVSSAGKTECMKKMIASPYVLDTDDVTSRELSEKLKNRDMTHLVLYDLTSLFGHRGSTVKLSVNMLRRVIEEGLFTDSYSGQKIANRHLGLITGIPPEDFAKDDVQHAFESGGFGTRFIIAKFDYDKKTVREAHHSVRDGLYEDESFEATPLILPKDKARVVIPENVTREIETLALLVKRDEIGLRMHKQLRALVAASAAERGRTEAAMKDFLRVEALSEFFTAVGRTL